MKRFYKDVSVEAGQIFLDRRPVKTPARADLILPDPVLAQAIADEWSAQGETINPQSMPFTGLANAAIDRVAQDATGFAQGLAVYGETELLCYRADNPPPLVARQNAEWDPILDWARQRFDVSFTLTTSIMHRPQPETTINRLAEALSSQNPYALAALSPIVTISGSLVIALALVDQVIDSQAAFAAAHLDELWQIEQWGEDSLALDARTVRQRDFGNACDFLNLVRNLG